MAKFGIQKLYSCESSQLDCEVFSLANGIASYPRNILHQIPLCAQREATLEITDSQENGQTKYNTTLSYFAEERVKNSSAPRCYIVHTIEGQIFIIGTKERPYIIQSSSFNITGTAQSLTGSRVNLLYSNIYPLVQVF